jgi:glc operon protein GlcG
MHGAFACQRNRKLGMFGTVRRRFTASGAQRSASPRHHPRAAPGRPIDIEGETMRSSWLGLALAAAALPVAAPGQAQQQPPAGRNPLDVAPEKMPFATPYGAPISLQRAKAAIQAAVDEAGRRGWAVNVAVLDSGANLVAFARMDGAQLGSIAIAQHKARAAVKYRRPTKYFEERIQQADAKFLLTLDDVIASRGGIPLIEGGKLIGAIGCSGATGSQDEAACEAGAATINR